MVDIRVLIDSYNAIAARVVEGESSIDVLKATLAVMYYEFKKMLGNEAMNDKKKATEALAITGISELPYLDKIEKHILIAAYKLLTKKIVKSVASIEDAIKQFAEITKTHIIYYECKYSYEDIEANSYAKKDFGNISYSTKANTICLLNLCNINNPKNIQYAYLFNKDICSKDFKMRNRIPEEGALYLDNHYLGIIVS